jgi:parallel beta-helix repeat protein
MLFLRLNYVGLGERIELFRKTVSGIMLTLLVISMVTLAFNVQPVASEENPLAFEVEIKPEYPTIDDEVNVTAIFFDVPSISYGFEFGPLIQVDNEFSVNISVTIPYILPWIYVGEVAHTYPLGKLPEDSYSFSATVSYWYQQENGSWLGPFDYLYDRSFTVSAPPTTIIVPDDYSTIQEAVNAANPGDTVFVKSGTYCENVVVNKTVSIIGEDKENTIIDGQENGDVILINANGVCIKGFTIRNSSLAYYHSGVLFSFSNFSVISDSIIIDCNNGVCINSANGNNIEFNLICNNNWGISFCSLLEEKPLPSNNTLIHNDIANNSIGICLDDTSGNVIVYNNLENNYQGISSEGGLNNSLTDNNITDSQEYGIWLIHCDGNTLMGNIIRNSSYYLHSSGIYLVESFNNTLTRNSFRDNRFGLLLYDSGNNTIQHNNFINNTLQTRFYQSWPGTPPLTNTLDNGYPSGGNYWSDYTGVDLYCGPYQNETGSDGIGDTPYVIDVNNSDRYPLMHPWKLGDVNYDGEVNVLDLIVVATALGTLPSETGWNHRADVKEDNEINVLDLILVAVHLGT